MDIIKNSVSMIRLKDKKIKTKGKLYKLFLKIKKIRKIRNLEKK